MTLHPRFTPKEIIEHQQHIRSVIVQHVGLVQVVNALVHEVQNCSDVTGKLTALVGPSGSGKTVAIRQVQQRLADEFGKDGSETSVLTVPVPFSCTIRAFAASLLYALNDPSSGHRGTTCQKSRQIVDQLRAQNVRVVVLDDIHVLSCSGKRAAREETMAWLLNLLDGAGIPVICVGLPATLTVISENEQLRLRTTKIINAEAFSWDDNDHKKSEVFRTFLRMYEQQIGFPEFSEFSDEAFAKRLHIASRGLVSVVALLTNEAARLCLKRDQGPMCVRLVDFKNAYNSLFPYDANPFRPF
jgi:hypothetical protein